MPSSTTARLGTPSASLVVRQAGTPTIRMNMRRRGILMVLGMGPGYLVFPLLTTCDNVKNRGFICPKNIMPSAVEEKRSGPEGINLVSPQHHQGAYPGLTRVPVGQSVGC